MPITLFAGLARLRIALMIAGMAWLFGIVPPPPMRILLAVLVVGALVLDVVIDGQKLSRHYVRTKQPDEYQPAA